MCYNSGALKELAVQQEEKKKGCFFLIVVGKLVIS